jgi:DASH complex subunit DAD3
MSAFAPEDPDNDYSYAEVDPAETSTPPIPQSMGDADASHGRGHSNNPLLGDNPLVSDLEQEVLEEYARLLRNVNQVRGEDALVLSFWELFHGERIQCLGTYEL